MVLVSFTSVPFGGTIFGLPNSRTWSMVGLGASPEGFCRGCGSTILLTKFACSDFAPWTREPLQLPKTQSQTETSRTKEPCRWQLERIQWQTWSLGQALYVSLAALAVLSLRKRTKLLDLKLSKGLPEQDQAVWKQTHGPQHGTSFQISAFPLRNGLSTVNCLKPNNCK